MSRDLPSRVIIGYRGCPAIAFSTKNLFLILSVSNCWTDSAAIA